MLDRCEALSQASRYFTERGIRPHFALRSTHDERVPQTVTAGLRVTVMPDRYQQEGVVRPRLRGFTLERSVGFMTAQIKDR